MPPMTAEEIDSLTDLLDQIGDQLHDSEASHDAGCWQHHRSCALYAAVDLLVHWQPHVCGEHEVTYLAPECPECRVWSP
jgi:hypothetical protein